MKNIQRILVLSALVGLCALPLSAYTVVLKDGSQLIAQKAPTIQGDQAIIILQSGTRTSIDASEIDVARTKEANKHELGSALVLEGGEFTNKKVETEAPKEESLSDVARRRSGAASRAPVSRVPAGGPSGSGSDLSGFERTPYRDLEILEAIQGAFRSQSVDGAKIFQGTAPGRLLIEVETNSEATVFRSIKVAAGALNHVRTNLSAAVDTFELVLETTNRSRAGMFVMTTEHAEAIAAGELEISTYFVDQVRF